MRISKVAFVASAFYVAAACTSAADIHTLQSPKAHFGLYHTFSFDEGRAPPGGYSASSRSADVRSYARDTVVRVLETRGYEPAQPASPDPPDLIMRIEVGRRQANAPLPNSVGLDPSYPGYQGDYIPVDPPYHGFLDQEDQELIEGAIVIDAFEGKTHELLWHGFARALVQPDKIDYDRLRRTVESVLSAFPASTPR